MGQNCDRQKALVGISYRPTLISNINWIIRGMHFTKYTALHTPYAFKQSGARNIWRNKYIQIVQYNRTYKSVSPRDFNCISSVRAIRPIILCMFIYKANDRKPGAHITVCMCKATMLDYWAKSFFLLYPCCLHRDTRSSLFRELTSHLH